MKRTPIQRKTPLRQVSPKKAAGQKATTIRASIRRPARQKGQQNITAAITGKPRKPLKQGRSTGKPTKVQLQRFIHIKEIGCIACLCGGWVGQAAEVHHLTIGGRHGQKRRGHDFTIGLCRWHHRGESPYRVDFSITPDSIAEIRGPSYHHHARRFREKYGQDDELLELQNQLISLRARPAGAP